MQEEHRRSIDGSIEVISSRNSRSSLGSFVLCSDNQFGGLVHPPHQLEYSDNQCIHSSSSESFRSIDNQQYPGNLDEESNQDSGEGCEDIVHSLAPVGSNEDLGGDATASADATASMHHLHIPPKTLCSTEGRPKVDELEGREPRWVSASSQPISQPEPFGLQQHQRSQ